MKAYEFPVEMAKVQRPRRRADVRGPVIPQVRRALVLAYQIEALIREGKVPNHATAARWLGISRGRVAQVCALLLLAPEIQEAVLTAPPERLAPVAEGDLRGIALLPEWVEQRVRWTGIWSSG